MATDTTMENVSPISPPHFKISGQATSSTTTTAITTINASGSGSISGRFPIIFTSRITAPAAKDTKPFVPPKMSFLFGGPSCPSATGSTKTNQPQEKTSISDVDPLLAQNALGVQLGGSAPSFEFGSITSRSSSVFGYNTQASTSSPAIGFSIQKPKSFNFGEQAHTQLSGSGSSLHMTTSASVFCSRTPMYTGWPKFDTSTQISTTSAFRSGMQTHSSGVLLNTLATTSASSLGPSALDPVSSGASCSSLNYGTSTTTTTTTTPALTGALTFGDSSTSSNFGSQVATSFGLASNAQPTTSLGFVYSTQASATKMPMSFVFGNNKQAPTSSGFGFNLPASSNQPLVDFGFGSSAQPPTPFTGFGSSPCLAKSTFGLSSNTQAPAPSEFGSCTQAPNSSGFGLGTQAHTVSGFGSSTCSSASPFSFVAKIHAPTSSTPISSSLNFGTTTTLAVTGSLTFGTSAPTFGESSAIASPSFSIGTNVGNTQRRLIIGRRTYKSIKRHLKQSPKGQATAESPPCLVSSNPSSSTESSSANAVQPEVETSDPQSVSRNATSRSTEPKSTPESFQPSTSGSQSTRHWLTSNDHQYTTQDPTPSTNTSQSSAAATATISRSTVVRKVEPKTSAQISKSGTSSSQSSSSRQWLSSDHQYTQNSTSRTSTSQSSTADTISRRAIARTDPQPTATTSTSNASISQLNVEESLASNRRITRNEVQRPKSSQSSSQTAVTVNTSSRQQVPVRTKPQRTAHVSSSSTNTQSSADTISRSSRTEPRNNPRISTTSTPTSQSNGGIMSRNVADRSDPESIDQISTPSTSSSRSSSGTIRNLLTWIEPPFHSTPISQSNGSLLTLNTLISTPRMAALRNFLNEYSNEHPALTQDANPRSSLTVPEASVSAQILKDAKHKIEVLQSTLQNPHRLVVKRSSVLSDVLSAYANQELADRKLYVSFFNECGVDTGGLSRDMFTMFWNEATVAYFHGEFVCSPYLNVLEQKKTKDVFKTLGKILSHSVATTGELPLKISRSCLAVICDCEDELSPEVLLEDFLLFVTESEARTIRQAIASESFSADIEGSLFDIFMRFQGNQKPDVKRIKEQIVSIAETELVSKPYSLLVSMKKGIPSFQKVIFWNNFKFSEIQALYDSLRPTPDKILELLKPDRSAANLRPEEEVVFYFLKDFVRSMDKKKMALFLQFVSGSPVLPKVPIRIYFNRIDGLARAPVVRTCSCTLELSVCYQHIQDFRREFDAVLYSDEAFSMGLV